MSIERAEKKLREARYFLAKLREQHDSAFGDKEPIDFCFSAFLNATRSVGFMLGRAKDGDPAQTYKQWRTLWERNLSAKQLALHLFFISDRDVEVHADGSTRAPKTRGQEVGDTYSDASGRLEVFAPPGTPPAVIQRPSYTVNIDGIERALIDATIEVSELLEAQIGCFRADHPGL